VNASKENARNWLRQAQSIAVLTGAGVSAESGIPTFRGAGGLWRNFRAEDLATPEAFAAKSDLVREWYQWRRAAVRNAAPNPAHHALAKQERRTREFLLITQNVDDLHERAGSRNIAKLHGSIMIDRCVRCQREQEASQENNCQCGGRLRPGVVWFGEALPEPEYIDGVDYEGPRDATEVALVELWQPDGEGRYRQSRQQLSSVHVWHDLSPFDS